MAKSRGKSANGSSPRKGTRPTWEGHLRLSLVTCPVALYSAVERSAEVHFNLINPKTHNRIRMQAVDAGTGKPVERADLVRGFAVSKNKYVLFDKEELDAVKLESTRTIDIEEFVDANTIDRIYWDEPTISRPTARPASKLMR
jgi:DNA end-binding protein Ku